MREGCTVLIQAVMFTVQLHQLLESLYKQDCIIELLNMRIRIQRGLRNFKCSFSVHEIDSHMILKWFSYPV